jgi:hypothetical protein
MLARFSTGPCATSASGRPAASNQRAQWLRSSRCSNAIGCQSAAALRKAGFDARYLAGGHYAWKAAKGPVRLFDPEAATGAKRPGSASAARA